MCAPLQANFPAIARPQCRKFLLKQIDGAHMHDPESNRGQRPHASTETARTHDRPASAPAIGSWLALLPSIAFALVLARRTPLKTSLFTATCPLCRVGEQRSGKTLANQETEEERVCQTFRVRQSRRLSRQILVLTVGHDSSTFLCFGRVFGIDVWICDLASHDPTYVLPIMMGITMFIQQKLTPTTGDPRQAKMMLFMPVIFTFMFLNLPSGLVLYWTVSNVLQILQQKLMNRPERTRATREAKDASRA